MKAFNLIFCFIFTGFAVLQYNDPDPYIWVPLYMYSAVLCWLAFRGKYFRIAYLAGILVYAVYAGYKFFDENGVWDWITKHHEENIAATMKGTSYNFHLKVLEVWAKKGKRWVLFARQAVKGQ